jgi:type VI secretion system secreted protein VgrG
LPLAIEALITSAVTPDPAAAFSSIEFSTEYDGVFAIDPKTVFQNPVGHMYGSYSYDKMTLGSAYTEVWYRDGSLVHFEPPHPWGANEGEASGGYGYVDWNPAPHEWLPGNYQVQVFVGLDWKVVGEFVVEGAVPTASPTRTMLAVSTETPTSTSETR